MITSFSRAVVLLSLLTASNVFSSQEKPAIIKTAPTVVERGANFRVWETTTTKSSGKRKPTIERHAFTELGSGLCYELDGKWADADPEIVVVPDGAGVSHKAQSNVRLSADVNADVAVEITTPSGNKLRSSVIGICYYDWKNQRDAQVAGIKSTVGSVVGKNQVIYSDAFDTIKADVRYTSRKAGLGQDVILREQLPSPADFQMDPQSTRVEIWTEFFDRPKANLHASRDKFSGETTHDIIDFGDLRIIRGNAFSIGQQRRSDRVPVKKQWKQIQGRTFLVESVDFIILVSQLADLPHRAQVAIPHGQKAVAKADGFVPHRNQSTDSQGKKLQIAMTEEKRGYVIDYETAPSDADSYTFRGDTTYYVSDLLYVTNTITFEGNTVIKFGSSGGLEPEGAIQCLTSPYHPAILTSKDDDSVGELLAGISTGSPSPTGVDAIHIFGDAALHDMRFSYFTSGIVWDGNLSMTNVQFVHCSNPLSFQDGSLVIHNALFNDFSTAVYNNLTLNSLPIEMENATFSHGNAMFDLLTDPTALATNCVFAFITNSFSGIDGSYNGFYSASQFGTVQTVAPGAPFQTVGAGSCYLADSSGFRDVGTTNIDSELLASLKKRTTYPPILWSDDITTNTVFSPQAWRDTDVPDLGYHYECLDYAVGQRTISGASLTLTNGVAVGLFVTNDDQHGSIMLECGANLVSQGTALALNHLVWYNAVQEQSTTNWNLYAPEDMINLWNYSCSPIQVNCRFTDFSRMATGNFIGQGDIGMGGTVSLRDCSFSGGGNLFASADSFYPLTVGITNCLFRRGSFTGFGVTDDLTINSYNNLFYKTSISLDDNVPEVGTTTCTFKDNLFYTNDIATTANIVLVHDYNGYLTNASRLSSNGAHDVILTNLDFQTGALGEFYIPTTCLLTNAGSQSATNAGLYHYTTTTNQVKEAASTVDIGFHYVVVNGSGNPYDTDGDGMPDYVEDANGNGAVNSGETDWQSATDLGLKVWITRPVSGSNLP